jgi:hypothetical protein
LLRPAGFVVAAITHTGDNFKDRNYAFRARNLIDRPRHVVRTIDHMRTIWPAQKAKAEPGGQRLLDDHMLNAVLVLMLTTSILGPVLTERFAPRMLGQAKC